MKGSSFSSGISMKYKIFFSADLCGRVESFYCIHVQRYSLGKEYSVYTILLEWNVPKVGLWLCHLVFVHSLINATIFQVSVANNTPNNRVLQILSATSSSPMM
jgi:hypothetical protein